MTLMHSLVISMDLDSRAREKDAGFEMRCYQRLLTTYIRTISPMMMLPERSNQPLENMTSDLGHETETDVVWPLLIIFRLNKDNSTGYSDRKKKKR